MISIIMYDDNLPSPLDRIPLSAHRMIALDSGDILFRQNDQTQGLFYVLDGHVELVRHGANGEAIIIHRAKKNETFAEASLFSQTYHCDARARAPSQIIGFERDTILAAFSNDPDFALQLTKRFASQIQLYRRRLELLAIKSATKRTYIAIMDGLQTGTVMDFASEIGLSHEATYRALSALVRANKIKKITRGRYVPL